MSSQTIIYQNHYSGAAAKPVMTAREFAEWIGVSVRTIQRRIRDGVYPLVKHGNRWLINVAKWRQDLETMPY